MERIISYEEIPESDGKSIYLRMETDPKLYLTLLKKGYRIINNINNANEESIYITGKRQVYSYYTTADYKKNLDNEIENNLRESNIAKPRTYSFSIIDLNEHKYKLPFVLKNENANGGREKFLINTEEDYENVIRACNMLINKNIIQIFNKYITSANGQIDYLQYLNENFTIQEYITTPSKYNTTVRLLTSSSNNLLYGSLKYKESENYQDNTSLLGYFLKNIYPISTKSIVSNTLRGGNNILIGESVYESFDAHLLAYHNIESEQFHNLVESTKAVHSRFKSELGIICGFDYIYDVNKEKWFLLEYHSKPMVGDYSKRQKIAYETKEDRLTADGRVRATALSLTLKKH